MEGELFTPRVFTKIIEIFVIIGKKWAFMPYSKSSDTYKGMTFFRHSGFLNSATESDTDHIFTLYVYIFLGSCSWDCDEEGG